MLKGQSDETISHPYASKKRHQTWKKNWQIGNIRNNEDFMVQIHISHNDLNCTESCLVVGIIDIVLFYSKRRS